MNLANVSDILSADVILDDDASEFTEGVTTASLLVAFVVDVAKLDTAPAAFGFICKNFSMFLGEVKNKI